MVNLGLTKVDDALAAKHPVGPFSFYCFNLLRKTLLNGCCSSAVDYTCFVF